jgi:hypothetical protein
MIGRGKEEREREEKRIDDRSEVYKGRRGEDRRV